MLLGLSHARCWGPYGTDLTTALECKQIRWFRRQEGTNVPCSSLRTIVTVTLEGKCSKMDLHSFASQNISHSSSGASWLEASNQVSLLLANSQAASILSHSLPTPVTFPLLGSVVETQVLGSQTKTLCPGKFSFHHPVTLVHWNVCSQASLHFLYPGLGKNYGDLEQSTCRNKCVYI